MRHAVILVAMIGARLAAQPASIEGTVVDQTTGKPLERVHIRLIDKDVYGAMSGASGNFSISAMQAGRYDMRAERSGYVQIADSDSLMVKAGQQLTDFKIVMAPASMLLGRVVDQFGDPVAGAFVQVIPVPPTRSSPSLVGSPLAQTDDRGEFQALVDPGKYSLRAELPHPASSGPPEVRSDGTSETVYLPTYYPSTANKERAREVEVAAGQDVNGLEIRLVLPASPHTLNVRSARTTPSRWSAYSPAATE